MPWRIKKQNVELFRDNVILRKIYIQFEKFYFIGFKAKCVSHY